MSHNYDNWERLVRAVLLREELIEIALRDSRDPSTITDGSSSSSNYDLSIGSNSSFPNQAHVNIHGEKRDQLIPMDYSDLTMNHTDWKAMLPPGENEIAWRSASLSFSQDKRTGKHCFMVGPRGLVIPEANHEFISYSQSRFSEVAEIKYNSGSTETPRWLSPNINNGAQTYIRCSIETQRLTPNTIYGAYLVFKLEILPSPCDDESDDDFFLNDLHKELHSVHLFLDYTIATIKLFEDEFADNVTEMQGHKGVLKRIITTRELNVVDRGNGWKELEIGNFFVEGKNRGEVIAEWKNMFLDVRLKRRPIVEGIEFRPTYRRSQSCGCFILKTIKQKQKMVSFLHLQRIILKIEVDSDKEKEKAMKAVSTLAGVEYIYMNMKELKLTVVGDVVPMQVLSKLRKSWRTELLPAANSNNTTYKDEDVVYLVESCGQLSHIGRK